MTQPNQDAGEELLHKLERESHCRTYAGALAADALAEIRRLQSIVEKLPKDGEGNPLAPGMKRWHRDIDAELHVEMVYVDECLCSGPKQKLVQGSDVFDSNELFSTRAAALVAAAAPGEGKGR